MAIWTKDDMAKAFSNWKYEEIPENWYVPAKEVYLLQAILLYGWGKVMKLGEGWKTAEHGLDTLYKILEDKSMTIGGIAK